MDKIDVIKVCFWMHFPSTVVVFYWYKLNIKPDVNWQIFKLNECYYTKVEVETLQTLFLLATNFSTGEFFTFALPSWQQLKTVAADNMLYTKLVYYWPVFTQDVDSSNSSSMLQSDVSRLWSSLKEFIAASIFF